MERPLKITGSATQPLRARFILLFSKTRELNFDMEDTLFSNVVGFILVAVCWGFTNPFMKKGSAGLENIKQETWLRQTLAEIWFLVTRWQYIVPLILNLSGSVVYYYTLGQADLSLAVPITNSLTFIFTTLAAALLGEDVGDKG
ncbi:6600_t:CDS:2, partial [Paraglomus brasilianum]